MMNNLFSIFDPSTNIFNLNWLVILILFMFFPLNFFLKEDRYMSFYTKISNFVVKDLLNNMNKNLYMNMIIFMVLFNLIYFSNLLGLMPFIFTITSHLNFTLSLALPIWLSLFLKGWFSNYNKVLIHLVPLNTPSFLCIFMVMIESISTMIRPFTLAIRLSANMIAGHILISLLSMMLNYTKFLYFVMVTLNLLILLELAVSMIQSYVFVVLLSLYLGEQDH